MKEDRTIIELGKLHILIAGIFLTAFTAFAGVVVYRLHQIVELLSR